jgi:hypothetical protein
MAANAVAGKKGPTRITRPAGAPRHPVGSRPATPAPPAEVLRLTSEPTEPEVREALFYIDDVEYTIPVDPSPGIAAEAMAILADGQGSLVAQAMAEHYIMNELLGKEGWAALRHCPSLKKGDLQRVMTICRDKAMGALEDPNS